MLQPGGGAWSSSSVAYPAALSAWPSLDAGRQEMMWCGQRRGGKGSPQANKADTAGQRELLACAPHILRRQ